MERNNSYGEDEITVDIGELITALWKKVHVIIFVGIVCAIAAFMGTKILITPQYDSVTKIYVVAKQNENVVTSGDLQAGNMLTKDYVELVKSRPVLEEVISDLDLDMSVNSLLNSITVTVPADTRIIKITVRNEDPELARDIADAVREVACVQIKAVMNIDAVNTVEDANLPTEKSTPNTAKNAALGGILGMLFVMGIVVLIFILDDTIKTPDDVDRYLDLNVLASIPVTTGSKKNKKAKKAAKKVAQQRKRKRR